LFFYSNKDHYLIDVKTKKGEKLVKDLKTLKKEIKIPLPKNTKILEKNDIENHYKNKIWESDADNCLSCSACTIYCPTCNCYDIKDNLELNFKDGNRTRHEISCHLKSFTRVAGEKCYRDSRLSRFKHFVYHKIVYFRKRYKRPMCVGCARCLRVCPTKIDWVSTINLLQDEIHPKGK
jgi:sulfhydrogenase subunit beta (sulfur reductase)